MQGVTLCHSRLSGTKHEHEHAIRSSMLTTNMAERIDKGLSCTDRPDLAAPQPSRQDTITQAMTPLLLNLLIEKEIENGVL